MRVAMIVPVWEDPVIPGIVRDLHAEFRGRGAEAFVIARREDARAPDVCEEAGLRVYRVGAGRRRGLLGLSLAAADLVRVPLQTLRLLSREPHDLVHYHFGGVDWNLVSLCLAWLRKPLVVTFHSPAAGRRWRVLRWMCRRLVSRAAGVSTIARRYEAVLRELFPGEGKRLATIESGIDTHFFQRASPPERVVRPYLLSVARLAPYKGLDLFLLAFLDMLREGRDLDWVVCGPEEDEGHFRGLAARLGLEGRVRLLGSLPKEEVARWIKGCEFLVMPAREGGSYSLAILEAFAAGRTAVATAAAPGQSGWRLTHEKDCLLFPPLNVSALKSEVCRLLDDAALRAGLERGARRTAAPLDRGRMVERYLDWYREVLAWA